MGSSNFSIKYSIFSILLKKFLLESLSFLVCVTHTHTIIQICRTWLCRNSIFFIIENLCTNNKTQPNTQFPVFCSFIASMYTMYTHCTRWSCSTLIYVPFANVFQSTNIFMRAFGSQGSMFSRWYIVRNRIIDSKANHPSPRMVKKAASD